MIITDVFYGLKCNRCGEQYDDGEHSFWSDESAAFENASESGWIEQKGKHYCENCFSHNEDSDEVTIFEDFPEHLKTLNKFIDRVAFATQRNVFEKNSEFLVKCRLYRQPKLKDYEAEFIKQLLGEKFISIEYIVGKYNSTDCLIKFKV